MGVGMMGKEVTMHQQMPSSESANISLGSMEGNKEGQTIGDSPPAICRHAPVCIQTLVRVYTHMHTQCTNRAPGSPLSYKKSL